MHGRLHDEWRYCKNLLFSWATVHPQELLAGPKKCEEKKLDLLRISDAKNCFFINCSMNSGPNRNYTSRIERTTEWCKKAAWKWDSDGESPKRNSMYRVIMHRIDVISCRAAWTELKFAFYWNLFVLFSVKCFVFRVDYVEEDGQERKKKRSVSVCVGHYVYSPYVYSLWSRETIEQFHVNCWNVRWMIQKFLK